MGFALLQLSTTPLSSYLENKIQNGDIFIIIGISDTQVSFLMTVRCLPPTYDRSIIFGRDREVFRRWCILLSKQRFFILFPIRNPIFPWLPHLSNIPPEYGRNYWSWESEQPGEWAKQIWYAKSPKCFQQVCFHIENNAKNNSTNILSTFGLFLYQKLRNLKIQDLFRFQCPLNILLLGCDEQ